MTGTCHPPSRRFLLLHGLDNWRPKNHWMWWLAEALRQRGEQVLYPQLPSPEQPSLEDWTRLLHAELAQLGGAERVVVCHSLGTALWLRACQDLPAELRVSRVLLVSPLGAQAFVPANRNEDFRPGDIGPAQLAAASTTPPRAVVSTTDPYAPADPATWGKALGVDCDILHDAGHITPDDGYGPWPAVLDWCLRERTPVTAVSVD